MHTFALQTVSCFHPEDTRSTDEKMKARSDCIRMDTPGGLIYLTREQAVQLATNLLTGFMGTVIDVTFEP